MLQSDALSQAAVERPRNETKSAVRVWAMRPPNSKLTWNSHLTIFFTLDLAKNLLNHTKRPFIIYNNKSKEKQSSDQKQQNERPKSYSNARKNFDSPYLRTLTTTIGLCISTRKTFCAHGTLMSSANFSAQEKWTKSFRRPFCFALFRTAVMSVLVRRISRNSFPCTYGISPYFLPLSLKFGCVCSECNKDTTPVLSKCSSFRA